MRSTSRVPSLPLLLSVLLCFGAVQASAGDAADTASQEAGLPQEARPTVTIGVLADGPYLRAADVFELLRAEMSEVLALDFEASFPDDKWLAGDWTVAGIEAELERLLADPEVDLVLTIGLAASQLAAQRPDLPKPVVAPLVVDAVVQGLPSEGLGSGVHNFNYLYVQNTVDIAAYREVVEFRSVALLIEESFAAALGDALDRTSAVLTEQGLDPRLVPVGRSIEDALAALDGDIEAVYLLPQPQFSAEEFARLVDGLSARRLPSFTWLRYRQACWPAAPRAHLPAVLPAARRSTCSRFCSEGKLPSCRWRCRRRFG